MFGPCYRQRWGMTDAPDREAIIDAVAQARPWRTPSYLVLYFLRRWAVVLFTFSFMLATRQHWAIAAIAIAGALWFDLRVTPNALDLRLDDREFVRKIYDLEEFQTDLKEEYKRVFYTANIAFLLFVLLSIFGQTAVDYNRSIPINKNLLNFFLFAIFVSYVSFISRNYPLNKIPHPKSYKEVKIELEEWKNHGYYSSRTFVDTPFTIILIMIFFVIVCGFIGVVTFSSMHDETITDTIASIYANVFSAMGFSVPAIMNIHAKGQRVARSILKELQGDKAS
jgi:hypothetical protein